MGSIAGVADNANLILFHKAGGLIVPEKLVNVILLRDKSQVSNFNRVGMVYRMNARARHADVGSHDFQGRGGQ